MIWFILHEFLRAHAHHIPHALNILQHISVGHTWICPDGPHGPVVNPEVCFKLP